MFCRLVKKKRDAYWTLLEDQKDVALDASFKVRYMYRIEERCFL